VTSLDDVIAVMRSDTLIGCDVDDCVSMVITLALGDPVTRLSPGDVMEDDDDTVTSLALGDDIRIDVMGSVSPDVNATRKFEGTVIVVVLLVVGIT
jgi:hypothetical protein